MDKDYQNFVDRMGSFEDDLTDIVTSPSVAPIEVSAPESEILANKLLSELGKIKIRDIAQ